MHSRAPLVISLVLILVAGATAQKTKAAQYRQKFVLSSKPFVYVEFERIGDRHPIREGETDRGVWLRFENNCTVPIRIATVGGSRSDVIHEVVYDELEYLWRPQIPRTEMPAGYTYDIRTTEVVQPGHSFTFSVPIEHITADWHIEIPFEFDVGREDCCQPRMNVVFSLNQVPIASRPMFERKKSQTHDR